MAVPDQQNPVCLHTVKYKTLIGQGHTEVDAGACRQLRDSDFHPSGHGVLELEPLANSVSSYLYNNINTRITFQIRIDIAGVQLFTMNCRVTNSSELSEL